MSAPHRLLYLIHLERLCTLAQCPLHRCLTLSVNMHDQLHFSTLNLAGTHSRILKKKRKKRKENATSPGCIFLPSSVSSSSSSLCLRSFSLNLSPYLPFLSSYSVPLRHSFNTDVWCNETKRERQLFPLTLFPLRPVSLPSFISYIFLFHPLFFSFFPFYFHVACPPHRFLLLSSSLLFLLSPLQSALLSVCFINKIYLL